MVDEWLAARMVGDDWPAAVPDDELGIAVQVVGVNPWVFADDIEVRDWHGPNRVDRPVVTL